jgi:hypothetical protein
MLNFKYFFTKLQLGMAISVISVAPVVAEVQPIVATLQVTRSSIAEIEVGQQFDIDLQYSDALNDDSEAVGRNFSQSGAKACSILGKGKAVTFSSGSVRSSVNADGSQTYKGDVLYGIGDFFQKSGITSFTNCRLWYTAVLDGDGNLTSSEFSVAANSSFTTPIGVDAINGTYTGGDYNTHVGSISGEFIGLK